MRGTKPAILTVVPKDNTQVEVVSLPPCPEFLDKLGVAEEWDTAVKSLHGRGLLADDVLPTLRLYVMTVWDVNDSLEKVAAQGRTQKDKKTGLFVKNPAVSDLKVAREEFLRYAVELGLTPSAKARRMSGAGAKSHLEPEEGDSSNDGAPSDLAF